MALSDERLRTIEQSARDDHWLDWNDRRDIATMARELLAIRERANPYLTSESNAGAAVRHVLRVGEPKAQAATMPITYDINETCPSCGQRANLSEHEAGDELTHDCGAKLDVQCRFEDADTKVIVWLETRAQVLHRLHYDNAQVPTERRYSEEEVRKAMRTRTGGEDWVIEELREMRGDKPPVDCCGCMDRCGDCPFSPAEHDINVVKQALANDRECRLRGEGEAK